MMPLPQVSNLKNSISQIVKRSLESSRFVLGLFLWCLLWPTDGVAGGTWTPLVNPPPIGVNSCLLLSDGTVLGMNGNGGCAKLTPDIHGSYVNGTWTSLASMNYSRLFFSSDVLTNGNVYAAGGEYGGGPAETYDSLANTWNVIQPPSASYSDAASKLLPSGNVLQSDSQSSYLIYNAALNTLQSGGSCGDMNETCWVRLPNDNVLGITGYSVTCQHYVPSLNAWYNDNNVPVPVFGYGGELGAAFVLPNGNVFQIGATTNTAIYTPGATLTSAGNWVAGPPMVVGTNQLGAVDAPAAMMANGNILCDLGTIGGFNGPCFFLEYNYLSNTFTQVGAPGGGSTYNSVPYANSMLCLPDGSVLFIGGQNSRSFYVYTPTNNPALAAGQPSIISLSENFNGSFHLTGTNLAGISAGAAYGDDEQMDSNYPLVRLTNNTSANVYYARSYGWNNTTIQNTNVMATEFALPQNLPAGTYSLVAVANGNPSSPTTFTYAPPPVPTGLVAASGSNMFVNLQWNASAGATAYNVKRAASGATYYPIIATVSGTNYVDGGLTNGLASYYKISAIGGSGPSADSAAVSATPAGPSLIPGATNINLTAYYNRPGIYTDGRTFSTGLDGSGYAYSANLLGISVFWNNLVFGFGPTNTTDAISCASQTISLPAGRYNSLQMLATGVQGSQANQTFTVTYSDNSTATFTQSFSDWANAQSYPGEFTVVKMPYRNNSSGGSQVLNMTLDGYIFTLDQTRTVKSITLPSDSNLIVMSMSLANDPVPVSLASYYNRAGIYTDGTTFTNPATGGLDGGGEAFSGSLLGSSQTWSNSPFAFGPLNATNVISCAGQSIMLPPGNYSRLQMLATGVQGSQTSQSFIVTYTDSTTSTLVQNMSDWFSPQNYSGESRAFPMSHRNNSNGTADNRVFYLYGYSFSLNNSKTVQSIKLPSNANVIVTAISLVPNWQPTFNVNPMTFASVNAGQSYSGTIATNANDLNKDALTYAKVSGPAWLSVFANGVLSGVPANSDANTNLFIVSVKDSGGLSNTASLYIYVNGAPSFVLNPFSAPGVTAGQNYSGTISTNATDPNPGDALTFGKIGGPAWLTVAVDGTLSGMPLSADVGTNTVAVSVADPSGLSANGTLTIVVSAPPQIVSTLALANGNVMLNWNGGIAPYQVQITTNLASPNWVNVGVLSNTNSISIVASNDAAFYRIVGQ